MTNLPITASTPQTSAPGKKPSGSAETVDAQNSQPFGAVLARRIGIPALKGAKADDRLAVELAAQTVADATDVRKEDKTAAEAAVDLRAVPPTDLPSEMLAALMPQALNTAVTTSAPAGAKTDGPATAPADVSGIPTRKPDLAAGIQTAATAQTAPLAVAEPQGRERAAFAAALVQAGNQTAASQEAGAVLREAGIAAAATSAAAVSAAAQQANTALPAAVQSAVASIVAHMGKAPKGYLVITPTRYISFYTGDTRKFGTSGDEKAALLDTLVGWSGTYRVEGSRIIVAVDTSWSELWNGKEQGPRLGFIGEPAYVDG